MKHSNERLLKWYSEVSDKSSILNPSADAV